MKLITTAPLLETEFGRLMKQYKTFYWATAWAGASSKAFQNLLTKKNKIGKLIVGIHFYQTHPDFIEAFVENKSVRFIEQPEGTFHPKLYVFFNNNKDWELLIGSANFTQEAFSRNTEASILMSSADSNSNSILKEAMELIKQVWTVGKVYDNNDLINYRSTWKIQRQKVKSLSGLYGSKKRKPRPIHEIPVINRSWEEFMREVRNETTHGLEKRIQMMDVAKLLFAENEHFNLMTEDQRKFIAGIPNKLDLNGGEYWAYFGSMKGAGIFKNKIIVNNADISRALDQIPQAGQITKRQYEKFVEKFKRAFAGNYIATATRLLCMKRPDTFICFDSKNRSALCKDFGILQSEMNYDRYWDDIVERIYDSNWWQNPNPANETENKVSNARAAFLDSLYYEE